METLRLGESPVETDAPAASQIRGWLDKPIPIRLLPERNERHAYLTSDESRRPRPSVSPTRRG